MKTFDDFIRDSGFKLLSVINFSRIEYKVILYLLNCASSGISSFVSTIHELAKILDIGEDQLDEALNNLVSRCIIKMKLNSNATSEIERVSFLLSMNFNYSKWNVTSPEKDQIHSSHDALIFPFVRNGSATLRVVKTEENQDHFQDQTEKRKSATVDRVFQAFVQSRSLTDHEIEITWSTSLLLVDTYHVDQIIVLLKYFGKRINSLEQLAGNWQHFTELFSSERIEVDLVSARKQHYEQDQEVRNSIEECFKSDKSKEYSDEEVELLNMLKKHRHIRRQLFWAYQVRSRYPSLSDFFEKHQDDMLPVTKSGQIVPSKNS